MPDSPTPPVITSFTPGDIVISVVGDGDGSGTYTDNQASPIVLEEIDPSTGTIVGTLTLREQQTTSNGTTEYPISGEYGSSSEGSLELAANGESLVIAGYGVNAATFNAGGAAVYGSAAEGQTTSVPGGEYTAVPRVIDDISYDGTQDTSTALYNVFNENNPRSVATVDGSTFYVAGQGVKGDKTQGVFEAADGASSATAIDTSTDARTVEIYGGRLYVSRDSTQNAVKGTKYTSNISSYGASLPTSATAPTVLPDLSQSVTLAAGQGNNVNVSNGTVDLSPENFFFASSTVLYVADSGNPKGGTVGDGGLQKWVLSDGTWKLAYTLSSGLNLVANTGTSGSTGLIGLTGEVNANGTVTLYATNSTIGDLDQTYLYSITDTLSATTNPGNSFTVLETAAADTNIRGVAFAPSEAATCFCPGTRIATPRGAVAVEDLAIGDSVLTVHGGACHIQWIGRRSYDGAFIAGQHLKLPVRIARDAIGRGVPSRDLWVSPGHGIYLDGVLVPAWRLINGVSITQAAAVDSVAYFHIELREHDVILAEDCPAESFLDTGCRGQFHNAATWVGHPARDPAHPSLGLPRLEGGFQLEAIRQRLAERAGAPAAVHLEGPLHGFVDQAGPVVSGWAQDESSPEVPVCLDVFCGGRRAARVLANHYRADLRAAGLGSGCHGFEVALPSGMKGEIDVRRCSDGAALALTASASVRAA